MCVCIYVCMHVCTYVHLCVIVHMYVHICMCVCVYVCVHVRAYLIYSISCFTCIYAGRSLSGSSGTRISSSKMGRDIMRQKSQLTHGRCA